jgi:membrane associated rhomboid family serine protease
MGIYDRDYYRDEPRSWPTIGGSMVTTLIVINVAIFVADMFADRQLSYYLALHGGLFRTQWQAWQLLTYGFAHDPSNVMHILLNMFALWLFGRDVETIYGPAEFLRIYLTTIVVAGLVWLATDGFWAPEASVMLGASGAVMGIMMIYVMHYPKRTFLLNFFIPVPAWLLMAIYVVFDVMGAVSQKDNVAHMAHLAGVAYGFFYYRMGWNFGRLTTPAWLGKTLSRRPPLKVHREPPEESLEGELDRILEKMHREGEQSLTKGEREILVEASRRYQRRQQK